MEYILINEGKLKVMLDREDLAERNICAERLDYANPEARQIFGDILQYAKKEFGFDTSGHRVLLQLYPSRDGGCELFISRIGDGDKGRHKKQNASSDSGYSFQCLDHLLSVCRILSRQAFEGESSVWYDSDGCWYLIISTLEDETFIPLTKLSFISEYGEPESARSLSLYLSEYATPLCLKNAVELLGRI